MDNTAGHERLDQHVANELPDLSRSAAAHLIKEGRVKINGKIQTKPSYRLRPDDQLNIDFDPSEVVISSIDLPIIYEDGDCVVLNKPIGVLTHSKGAFNPEATVATWLSEHASNMTGERAGIVHRLDRATSGVMICAKTPDALGWLQKQFSQRKTKKLYYAVVAGRPKQDQAVIDMPIERNPKKPQTFRVGSNGKPATTNYQVLQSNDQYSLLELRPTTGRTHQLRVHMAKLGHPILGDSLYGGKPADRLYLHAASLELTLPSKQRRIFEVPLPNEFKEISS